jgi:3-oxoacyl-[acyl-carrier protein] reductase
MDLGLNGKVAMVAGASKGLGFAIAESLAKEGARVSIASRAADSVEEAVRRINNQVANAAVGFVADVTSPEAIADWHRATAISLGPVGLLVTNSGGPPPGTFASLAESDWQKAFELLVLSVIRLVREVLPGMESQKAGSIVLLTSSSVKEPVPNLALSNVLRASVAALAKLLANEYAGRGIRVNHVVPGRIATDRVHQLDQAAAKRLDIPVEEQVRRSLTNIPLGRYGDPAEFGRAVTFLLSDAASYITGATLQVDGGQLRGVL